MSANAKEISAAPRLAQTPSQTVGPFFHYGLVFGGENVLRRTGVCGQSIVLTGEVRDGDGVALPDALLEIWQADGEGRFPESNAAEAGFRGFGRSATTHAGNLFRFETVKPGRVRSGDDDERLQAPHVCVRIFARGLLTHLTTRMYFEDEPDANARDEVLASVPETRRATLLARKAGQESGGVLYRWDVRLQGEGETVFFDA